MASDNKASKFNAFLDTKYIPLDNKIKLAIFIALLVVPIGLFYFLVYTKNVQQIDNLNKQKATLQAEIAKAKKAAAELDKMKAAKMETEELFKKTATVLPKEKEIPGLLTSISDLGKRAGLEFNQFKPGGEIPKDFYAEIPVDIQIKGPYHNLGYFLDKVSKLERIVTVDNINISSPKKEGNEMILSSNCRLTTYRYTGIQQAQPQKGKPGRR
ncbi:MAG: type 4a pilus biogenesis protein PilO [Desulfobulbaceae bacterium]|nr:type 4a pilus biogenesis protein PilO [Desulfobulbaceae bacterium]